MIRALIVVSIALLFGGWAVIDLLVHAASSLIRRGVRAAFDAWRRWKGRRHDRYWGLESYDEDAQEYVRARLRCDATRLSGVTDEQWREFVEAHPLTQVGGCLVTASTKLALAGVGAAAVTGLWLGYTKAAFFLPKATPQLLFGLERQAKRAARRERVA